MLVVCVSSVCVSSVWCALVAEGEVIGIAMFNLTSLKDMGTEHKRKF